MDYILFASNVWNIVLPFIRKTTTTKNTHTVITVPQSKRNITESFYLESSIRYICIYSNKYMNNKHIQRVNLLIQVHISDYKWMDTFLLLFRFIIHRWNYEIQFGYKNTLQIIPVDSPLCTHRQWARVLVMFENKLWKTCLLCT